MKLAIIPAAAFAVITIAGPASAASTTSGASCKTGPATIASTATVTDGVLRRVENQPSGAVSDAMKIRTTLKDSAGNVLTYRVQDIEDSPVLYFSSRKAARVVVTFRDGLGGSCTRAYNLAQPATFDATADSWS